MDNIIKKDMEAAVQAITSMIGRAEKAQGKFVPGTSQYTLQKNRINALYIAAEMIRKELKEGEDDPQRLKSLKRH